MRDSLAYDSRCCSEPDLEVLPDVDDEGQGEQGEQGEQEQGEQEQEEQEKQSPKQLTEMKSMSAVGDSDYATSYLNESGNQNQHAEDMSDTAL